MSEARDKGKTPARPKKVGITLTKELVEAARSSSRVEVTVCTTGEEPLPETVHLERCATLLEKHFRCKELARLGEPNTSGPLRI